MAHILPDGDLFAWCAHGTPLGHTCQWCRPVTTAQPAQTGWECPRCHRVWNPAVLACYCPEPVVFTAQGPVPFSMAPESALKPDAACAMSLMVPPEMTKPGSYRQARISKEWTEVWAGLECRYGGTDSGSDFALAQFRLKPAGAG